MKKGLGFVLELGPASGVGPALTYLSQNVVRELRIVYEFWAGLVECGRLGTQSLCERAGG